MLDVGGHTCIFRVREMQLETAGCSWQGCWMLYCNLRGRWMHPRSSRCSQCSQGHLKNESRDGLVKPPQMHPGSRVAAATPSSAPHPASQAPQQVNLNPM